MNRLTNDGRGTSSLADRLALTSRDRRLESRVLLEMICDSNAKRDAVYGRWEGHPDDVPDAADASEDVVLARARMIAGFLCAEYAIETLDQKVVICELAVELAQRIADELDGASTTDTENPTS